MFPVLAGSNPSGYNLTRSLRFRASASAYLNRTPASAGNRQIWTWSGWVKRGALGIDGELFDSSSGGGAVRCFLRFSTSNVLYFQFDAATASITTTQVFRDPSSWYHIMLAADSTQATASNRLKLYVNGAQITAGTFNYPSLNANSELNIASQPFTIGRFTGGGENFDGYLTEVNFIDGQALTPSSFGSTNSTTGVWQPARYTGTYGTNGFYLPFTDNSALTTSSNVGLGRDYSGNGNYWATNNISLTSGVTYDSMTDVPTLTSATASNFAVLNPLDKNTNLTLSNGNLTAIPANTADYYLGRVTIAFPSSGKYYWELTLNNTPYLYIAGIYSANRPYTADVSSTGNEYQVSWGTWTTYIKYQSNGAAFANWGTNTNPTSGDVLMFAVDVTNGTMWIGRNGTWYNTSGTANPATNTDPRFSSVPSSMFAGVNLPNPASGGVSLNFGQQPFTYTPPTGFVALNTYNLPTSTVLQGNKVMDATLYTGNSSTQTVTNAGAFKPDLVWIKDRSSVAQHVWTDSARGVDRQLFSSLTNAEQTSATGITSLNSNGFSLGVNVSPTGNTNGSPDNFVAWQWQAGQGSTSSNTIGTITSTVSVNASAGFSVVTWTGTGANATVGHGLGVAPQLIINKPRNAADNWISWHTSLGATGYIYLNLTNASATAATVWNSTLPTSSVFSVGTSSNINTSGQTMVSYCWTPIAGYSAFGSYTGNGSADGPFVYLGFRPKFVLIKMTSSTGDWYLYDSSRDPYNATQKGLLPNSSASETTYTGWGDLLSNGFKIRRTDAAWNSSGGTYIYACFSENPFRNSLAR